MVVEQIQNRYNDMWIEYCKKTITDSVDVNESSPVYEFMKPLYIYMISLYEKDQQKYHTFVDFLENKKNFTQSKQDIIVEEFRKIMKKPKFSVNQSKKLFKVFCTVLPRKKIIHDLIHQYIEKSNNETSLSIKENEKVRDITNKACQKELIQIQVSHERELRKLKDIIDAERKEKQLLLNENKLLRRSNNDKDLIIQLLQHNNAQNNLTTHAI